MRLRLCLSLLIGNIIMLLSSSGWWRCCPCSSYITTDICHAHHSETVTSLMDNERAAEDRMHCCLTHRQVNQPLCVAQWTIKKLCVPSQFGRRRIRWGIHKTLASAEFRVRWAWLIRSIVWYRTRSKISLLLRGRMETSSCWLVFFARFLIFKYTILIYCSHTYSKARKQVG